MSENFFNIYFVEVNWLQYKKELNDLWNDRFV
jgi:hypothetical protein